ncbi:MAG TPA: ATP-binding protein, partial [Thermoleophilaceae bacterium]
MEATATALFEYLRRADARQHARALDLRERITAWLEYIPATFPHYTRHTVAHSDEIVRQLSALLFASSDPSKPTVQLSSIEAYVLLAAAYLHDAGMVVSNNAKMDVLSSSEWESWTSGGNPGADRWQAILALRAEAEEDSSPHLHFAADLETRFLLADYFRRTHASRAAQLIQTYRLHLGLADADPTLVETISAVCVAHGASIHDLEDSVRYPERRMTAGEQVNVRFLALLLRLGDLLDMSTDRSCSLLVNAAAPLPADSLAHWTQYSSIVHRLTAPDRIEVRAKCHDHEEHRVLRDWCDWLAQEVTNAAALMAHSARHGDWRAPITRSRGPDPTIEIDRAQDATYVLEDWKLEIDADAVLTRLTEDIYGEQGAFLRELIQNALDASRCQMYLDLRAEGIEPPPNPAHVEAAFRDKYGVRVAIDEILTESPVSGKRERRHVITVEDSGIGMDREVIQRFFLQIGRSFYTSREFDRVFTFVPTSRFGLGFLSVFGVSDDVTVETYKPSSAAQDGPLRMRLTGSKSYLITEEGNRTTSGTTITVVLRDLRPARFVLDTVRMWCRMVELPIEVRSFGEAECVTA